MRAVVLLIMLLFQLNVWAQINTNPGGGPNGYGEIKTICPNLDPAVYLYERFFIQEMVKRHPSITEGHFFSLLEKINLVESLHSIQVPVQIGQPMIVCNDNDKDSLKIIYDMYKAAMFSDKDCAQHLEFTKKLEIMERLIKPNEKK